MDEISERARLAAQSILENESLTNGLDDSAASILIDWGVARAKAAAAQTSGMEDTEAEASLEENLRSLRRMLKGASRWAQALVEADIETARDNLSGAIEQAADVYGESFRAPDPQQVQALLDKIGEPAGELGVLLARLRSLFEPSPQTARRAAANPDEPDRALAILTPPILALAILAPAILAPAPPPSTEIDPPSTNDPPPDPPPPADADGEMPPSYTSPE